MNSENLQEESGNFADFADADNLLGKNLGVFKVVRELGRGGMGRVYLATRADGEFRQTVAIKLIKRGMDTDFILKRFRHERQILATLDHPYTARLLDGGTTDDGSPYFVMEYVEGKPLYRFCDDEKLSINARLKLFKRICEAVEYAHKRKIIHRDLKPGNIIINNDGIPKLLDFGIAKLLDSEQIHESINPTTGFMKLLTVEYASPEQVCGGEITPASDIYSLGVLLYELLTGHKVYNPGSNATVYQISQAVCENEPELPSVALEKEENFVGRFVSSDEIAESRGTSLKSLKNELSGNLDQIILKALAKSPEERFSSVAEFSATIEAHLNGSTVNIKRTFKSKPVVHRTSDPTTGGNKAIAVLPLKFLNPAADEDTGDRFLGLGLADSLITRLSGVKRFIVRPTSSILQYGEGFYDPFEAGEKLGVEYILDGNIYKSGERIRVSLQLFNVADKSTIWAEKFDEKSFDVLQLEDLISSRVAESLIPRLTSEDRENLAKRGTDNPQAFEMYLRGRAFWNKFTPENLVRAFESYEKAVALDPTYAQAHAGLADYYTWLGIYGVVPPGEAFPKAVEAAEKSVALDDRLAEAHATLGFAVHAGNYDIEKGEFHLTRALELNQNYASAFSWLAIVRFTQARFDEGLKLSDRAAEFDPLAPYNKYNYAWGLYYARRFGESIKLAKKFTKEFPAYGLNYYLLSKNMRFVGRIDEAFEQIEKAREIFGKSVFITFSEAECFAAAGKISEAREKLRRLDEMSAAGQYVSPYQTALVYCYLKDKENALQNLEKAFELKEPWLNWMNVEPVFDFVREETIFRKIAAQVHPKKNFSSPNTSENNPKPPTSDFSEAETAAYSSFEKKRSLPSVFKYVIAAILVLIAGFAIYKFVPRTNLFRNPFNNPASANWKDNFLATVNLKRFTTGGREVSAGISPDGKSVAYVSRDDENYSLWLRSVDSDDARQIVAPSPNFYSGVVFSPDGKYIYYSIFSRSYAERTLYRVNISAETGAPEKVLDDVNAAIGFSPDGKLFAYYSFNRQTRVISLLVAEMSEPNGAITATRTLASQTQPNVFVGNPSFSPDGKKIFYPVALTVEKKRFVNFFIYDLDSNTEEKFSDQTFGDVSATAWRKNGSDIIVSANDIDNAPFQLWLLAYPSGEATRMTDVSTNYFGLSLARNADVLISAKRDRTSSLWSINLDGSGNAQQLTAGAENQDGFYGITSSGEKLFFVSGISAQTSIQTIDADGKNAKKLPVEVFRPNNPVITKDGKFLFFADSKQQESVIWRYEFSSGELKQITPGYSLTPTLTPDEKSLVYAANNDQRRLSLFKLPVDGGGEQIQINKDLAVAPAISPDGKLVACYFSGKQTNGEWKLAVLSFENGETIRIFDLPETINLQVPPERPLAWSPDNRFIFYVNDKTGVSNIFKISLDENAAPEKVTNFSTGRIFDFTIFDEGKRIAYSQGAVTSEIVMFSSQSSKR